MPILERGTGLDRSYYRLPVLLVDDFAVLTPHVVRQVKEIRRIRVRVSVIRRIRVRVRAREIRRFRDWKIRRILLI
jgi:hypothetical protein